eukprot:6176475-Pleurochrysis_carterae.AAC.1
MFYLAKRGDTRFLGRLVDTEGTVVAVGYEADDVRHAAVHLDDLKRKVHYSVKRFPETIRCVAGSLVGRKGRLVADVRPPLSHEKMRKFE